MKKKKLIALATCASLVLSSASIAVDSLIATHGGVDIVSAATGATPAPKPAPKPTTPAKPATPATPAKPATPAAPVKPLSKYVDGTYVAYGPAYAKGVEGAKVTIKDEKIVDIELMRTSPTIIDRDARLNYKDVWYAYEPMKERFLGKTREDAAKVDIVSGATRSSERWKIAVDRAFERALRVKSTTATYFSDKENLGFMGVDPQGKYAVVAKFDANKLTDVEVLPIVKGSIVEPAAMNAQQKNASETIGFFLKRDGLNMKPVIGYESESKAVLNAYWDAVQNAKINNDSKYIDGFYSAYGSARDKGVERADIYIRNGKLVDVKLYRLGSDLKDRKETAYADVVKANAPMVKKLLEKGSYIENFDEKVDAIAGATESSHSWNLAVQRAFEKAAKVPSKNKYFNGTFAGVDNLSRSLVLVDINNDKVTKVTPYLFGSDKKIIKDEALSKLEKDLLSRVSASLLTNGVKMPNIKNAEYYTTAFRAAFEDALANASTKQGQYKDGEYTSNADSYNKGAHKVNLTLRNGKIVDIKLARTSLALIDRGASAYAEVVKNIPIFTENFIKAATRENVAKVDVVSGATKSGNGFKAAIETIFNKAEIVKTPKVPFQKGVFAGIDKAKSVYVLVTTTEAKPNLPTPSKVEVFFIENGVEKAADKLSADEKAVKEEIQKSNNDNGVMNDYIYRPAAFGANDAQKELSKKVFEAIDFALTEAGI